MKLIVLRLQEIEEWKQEQSVCYASEWDDTHKKTVRLWCKLNGDYRVDLGTNPIYEGSSLVDAIAAFHTRKSKA